MTELLLEEQSPLAEYLFVVPIDSWNRLVYLGFVNSIANLYSGR